MGKIAEITSGTVLFEINEMHSPVFTVQMVARQLGWGSISSRDYPYRVILRVLHQLHRENHLGMMNLPGSSNVTVWWNLSRFTSKEMPF